MPYARLESQALDDGRYPVYWLLLPLEANAQRHFADETVPSAGFWAHLWATLQRVLGRAKSPGA
jgi:hypothetical protein